MHRPVEAPESALSPRFQAAIVVEAEALRRRLLWTSGLLAAAFAAAALAGMIWLLPASNGDGEIAAMLVLMLPIMAFMPPLAAAWAFRSWYDRRVFGSVLAGKAPGFSRRWMHFATLQESALFPARIFGGRYNYVECHLPLAGEVAGRRVRSCLVTVPPLFGGSGGFSALFVVLELRDRLDDHVVVVPDGSPLPEDAPAGLAPFATGGAGFAAVFDAYCTGALSGRLAMPYERALRVAALAERFAGMRLSFCDRRCFVLVPWKRWDPHHIGLTVPVESLADLADFETMLSGMVEVAEVVVREDPPAA